MVVSFERIRMIKIDPDPLLKRDRAQIAVIGIVRQVQNPPRPDPEDQLARKRRLPRPGSARDPDNHRDRFRPFAQLAHRRRDSY